MKARSTLLRGWRHMKAPAHASAGGARVDTEMSLSRFGRDRSNACLKSIGQNERVAQDTPRRSCVTLKVPVAGKFMLKDPELFSGDFPIPARQAVNFLALLSDQGISVSKLSEPTKVRYATVILVLYPRSGDDT